MSIRLGTSMTRSRREYDRRWRGARAAMDATKAIPPRGDRKREAGTREADPEGSGQAERVAQP